MSGQAIPRHLRAIMVKAAKTRRFADVAREWGVSQQSIRNWSKES